jgi:hypothetical protein
MATVKSNAPTTGPLDPGSPNLPDPYVPGGGGYIGPTTGGSNVGVGNPLLPIGGGIGTGGGPLPGGGTPPGGGPGTVIIGPVLNTKNPGSDPFTGNFLCERYNYHIGPLIEIVQSNNSLVGPDGNAINLSQFPDHKNLSGTQCILLAPIYECCWVRNALTLNNQLTSTGAKQVGWVQLSRSRAILSYEECNINGVIGKKPVILQYFPEEEISSGGLGTVEGPDNPTKSVSLGFKKPPGTVLSSGVWGNCYGAFNTDSFLNWFSTNLYTTYNFQNLETYRTIGGYGLTDPSGNSLTNKLGMLIVSGLCVIKGKCVVKTTPPPSPQCIGSTVVAPTTPQEWLDSASVHFSTTSRFVGAILTDSDGNQKQIITTTGEERQRRLLNDGDLVDLEPYGFPCKLGQVGRFQTVSYASYPKFTFCRLSDGSTRLIFTDGVIEDRTNPIFDGPIVDKPLVTSQFNPVCCDRLKTAYLSNDSVTLNFLSNIGLGVQYIERTKKYELIDSCACEEVEIADLGCFFDTQNYSTILKADITDLRTHTGLKRQVVDERCKSDGPSVFNPFDRKRDIILNRTKSGTKGLFDGDDNMECYFTSSTKPTSSNAYYYEVTDCETCGRIPYFAAAYGHVSGSGSVFISNDTTASSYSLSATHTIYSQYQLMCLEAERTSDGISLSKFSFVSESVTVASDDIYVINFNRNGIKDRLDPGNFQISLSKLSGSFFTNSVHTGSNVKVGLSEVMHLIDDSDDFDELESCYGDPLTSYSIVSGTLDSGKLQAATVNAYGRVYPNLGVIILHPKRLNEFLSFNTVTGSNIAGNNAFKLFTAISGAAAPFGTRTDSHYITARNVKYKTTNHYFVRSYTGYSNYTNNPTFVSSSRNEIFDKCFIKEPQTYITSVGLYNSSRELMAIAKLSKPIAKTFDTDLLIKIRLSW